MARVDELRRNCSALLQDEFSPLAVLVFLPDIVKFCENSIVLLLPGLGGQAAGLLAQGVQLKVALHLRRRERVLQLKRQEHDIEVDNTGHLWKKKEPVEKKASGREDWSGGKVE